MSFELIDFLVQVVILFVDLLTFRRVTANRVLETHLSFLYIHDEKRDVFQILVG